jgi:hypothetical protein
VRVLVAAEICSSTPWGPHVTSEWDGSHSDVNEVRGFRSFRCDLVNSLLGSACKTMVCDDRPILAYKDDGIMHWSFRAICFVHVSSLYLKFHCFRDGKKAGFVDCYHPTNSWVKVATTRRTNVLSSINRTLSWSSSYTLCSTHHTAGTDDLEGRVPSKSCYFLKQSGWTKHYVNLKTYDNYIIWCVNVSHEQSCKEF